MFETLRKFPFFILVVMAFSVGMLFPALLAAEYGYVVLLQAFLRTGFITFILAASIGILSMDRKLRGDYRDHIASLLIVYLVLPFILALPIIQALPGFGFWPAVYEMLSSLTTTGATLITDTKGVNLILLVYTSLVAWMGAFLIVLIAFAIFEPAQIGGFELVADLNTGQSARSVGGGLGHSDRFLHYFKLLAPPYIIATAFLGLSLVISGERFLYAIIQSWSVLSTSGLSPYSDLDESEAHGFGEFIMFIFLIASFSRLYWLRGGQMKWPKHINYDPEMRVSTLIVLMSTAFFFVLLLVDGVSRNEFPNIIIMVQNIWGSIFTSVSFLASHGVKSEFWQYGAHFENLALPGVFLLGLAVMGGGVATTAGGIKLLRIYALFRLSQREVSRLIDPNSIAASGKAGRRLRKSGGVNAFVFLMLFIAGISTSALAFSFIGLEFEESILAAIASAANCGPVFTVLAHHKIFVADMDMWFYIVSGLTMIFGRVEVLVLISLFNPSFWLEERR